MRLRPVTDAGGPGTPKHVRECGPGAPKHVCERGPGAPKHVCEGGYNEHMVRRVIALALLMAVPLSAQTKRPPVRKPAPPPAAAMKKVAPEVKCPVPLGVGAKTNLSFCEVMAGRDPADGVLIQIPPHRGVATLTFDLHNLHTYSEEQIRAKRGYVRYTATIGALTIDNTLISRAVVQNEFRTAGDLVDRVGGGAGLGGVKAVAPTGTESISIAIPDTEDEVSILGEKLMVERADGNATYTQSGRPIADISNVMIEYQPGPPRPVSKSKGPAVAPRPSSK